MKLEHISTKKTYKFIEPSSGLFYRKIGERWEVLTDGLSWKDVLSTKQLKGLDKAFNTWLDYV